MGNHTEETKRRLLADMDSLMRGLRKCDTQAAAVDWMAAAYNAMDGATRLIGDMERMLREESSQQRGLVIQVSTPKLEVVQSISPAVVHRAIADKKPNYTRLNGETVVYPEFFMHPGLKASPRAWTRDDTRRLEAASKMGPKRIVHKSQ